MTATRSLCDGPRTGMLVNDRHKRKMFLDSPWACLWCSAALRAHVERTGAAQSAGNARAKRRREDHQVG